MSVLNQFVAIIFTILLVASQSQLATARGSGHGNSSRSCKASPGSAAWPSERAWAELDQSLGGRLLRPPPPGAVCHPGQPTFDAEQCTVVTAAWHTYDFHSNDPISNMWNQYSNDSCLPDIDYPCSAEGYPSYAVNATTADHIKLSFSFAKRYNVRLVVKSSGHDYQGRSTAPGALTIWVHHMQGLEILDSFQPHGCDFVIEEHAVTAAGGTQMITLYEELDKVNRTIVGGGGKTVAVGGYITGGGHSALAPRYGLGADQVLEIEVVTPKGDVLIANECQNKDLFWAMRGGGGSTFGVATSITMITHPTPHLVSWLGAIVSTEIRAPWFYDLVGYVLTQLSYLDSEGISGYIIVATNTTDPYGQFPGRYSAISLLLLLQDTQDVTKIQSILQPIFDHVQEAWPSALVVPVLNASYSSFLEWYNIFYDHASAGDDFYVGSWLMNAEAFQDASALSSAWVPFSEVGGGGTAYLVAGAGVRNAQPRGGGNAVCPAWRKALVHATNGIDFPSHDPSARQQALIKLNAAVDPLRQLAPDMGAYINENNPGQPDWKHSFWGDNYNRLLDIKRAVDPLDLLWCHPCVGNERWTEIGYQLCRVDDQDE